MVPTKDRNHSAVLLKYGKEGILVDCGEGTQRQLRIAGIPASKITKILISHWHGDHVLGLPGLLQTMSAFEYEGELEIYGPKGTKKHFEYMKKVFEFEERITTKIVEVEKGVFFSNNKFSLEALPMEHPVPCLGYSFVEKDARHIDKKAVKALKLPDGPLLGKLQEGKSVKWNGKTITPNQVGVVKKGKKITFITDTALVKNCYTLAEGADVLICEATYADALEEKAHLYKHLTAGQAGLIANKAGVKKLILTHFSQRYKHSHSVEEDARTVFDNVIAAKDFMKVLV